MNFNSKNDTKGYAVPLLLIVVLVVCASVVDTQ
jgi:hypothetical protein